MQSQTSAYVINSLIAAPQSALLTSLGNVKDELDIPLTDTSNDTRLTRWITEESAAISRYCNRIFGLATWQDEFRPQHGVRGEGTKAAVNPLKLTKFPLAAGAVLFSGNTQQNNLYITGIPSTAGLYAGMPVFGAGVQDLQSNSSSPPPVFGAGIPVGTTISTVNPSSIVLSKLCSVAQTGLSFTAGLCVQETIAGQTSQLIAGTDFEVDTGSLLPGDE